MWTAVTKMRYLNHIYGFINTGLQCWNSCAGNACFGISGILYIKKLGFENLCMCCSVGQDVSEICFDFA